jgi:hypothetical protein
LLAVVLVGCSGDNDDIAAPDVAETTTLGVDATASTPATVAQPALGEPRDVLFLADRAEIITKTVAELYRQRAQEALGVEVRVVETGQLYPVVGQVLEMVRGEAYGDLSDEVRDAEIIVVQTWPKGTVDDRGYFQKCWRGSPILDTPDPAVYDTAEYWASYQSVLGEIYAEISQLRQGAPTVLIGIDNYDGGVESQRLAGITEECRAFFERWSEAQREVAESHGAVWVSLYDTLNGPSHDLDAVQQGYLGPTEQTPAVSNFVSNEIGAEMIAEALAAVGFEPQP